MTADAPSLQSRLAAYLTTLWKTPVQITNLSRIPGGASRETYRFDARLNGATRGLVLRRDPVSTLIETERHGEYRAYESVHALGIPTPEPIHLDEHGGILERPFFIMGRIDGATAASPFAPTPYAPHETAIGEQFFTILGRIAAIPVENLPFTRTQQIPTPETCWQPQLAHWENTINSDELHPQPIVRAAIRRLRRTPPPSAQKISMVHGDYRSGNFLHDGSGRIMAILDWEMAHLGDPLEDLAWALDPLWAHGDPIRPAGTVPVNSAIEIWQAASGLTVDPRAFAWWRLFSAVKGAAIWISACHAYRQGGGLDPVLGFSGVYCGRRHDAIIAAMLEDAFEQDQAA